MRLIVKHFNPLQPESSDSKYWDHRASNVTIVVLTVQECFDPIADGISGGDLIPLMVHR